MSDRRDRIERWGRWLDEPVAFTRLYQVLFWIFVLRILIFGFGPTPWGLGQ